MHVINNFKINNATIYEVSQTHETLHSINSYSWFKLTFFVLHEILYGAS